ncbi:inactive carboxypeptidase-like protein X2 [Mya arenaria]|nr:inactive carboxypeptidase-like protein X2 [Mya arenaria]
MCNICGYDKISKTCFISNDNEADIILTSDHTKVVLKPIEHICENAEYLVNGVNPVSDAQLSASSVYDPGHAETGARLNTSPSLTTVGAWCAGYNDANQYIQVQFNDVSHVTGVAIQGRPINTDPAFPHVGCCLQYVTSYKVLYSSDCVNFITVKDNNGVDMVFTGNTDQDTVVTSLLPSQVTALCARVNPISYLGHVSLRFDILGCPIYN